MNPSTSPEVDRARVQAKPDVSIVTVADYEYGEGYDAISIETIIEALAAQDYEGTVELIVCESEKRPSALSESFRRRIPSLRVLRLPYTSSYELLNAGAHAASADVVGFVDGDCLPHQGWIRALAESLSEHPEVIGVSGSTFYPSDSFRDRVFALLSRSYVDPGGLGPTRFFVNNNGGMRREVWLRFPLPTDAGPYASRLQSEAIWRDGGRFLFDPRMRVVHDYEGWNMERDIRRHHGFSTVITRLRDNAIPHAWLVRLGIPAIPLIAAAKLWNTWRDCLRCAGHYGVRWYEIPAALGLAVVVHALEMPGMLAAYQGRSITDTRYH